jgi:hypothetical protein
MQWNLKYHIEVTTTENDFKKWPPQSPKSLNSFTLAPVIRTHIHKYYPTRPKVPQQQMITTQAASTYLLYTNADRSLGGSVNILSAGTPALGGVNTFRHPRASVRTGWRNPRSSEGCRVLGSHVIGSCNGSFLYNFKQFRTVELLQACLTFTPRNLGKYR